ncbi:hypothetical protein LZD49_09975 [Dyadobacter sp. CY261]|uniref:hypothetical protein n=1 Tax=Dyadobacter sp. CY261 TaxID=2907203 RepID=UPI001F16DFC6|nr:hypothetical protein [Dyadobacter sp. CY261]MCF0070799.1 hypothetical protein [Dyadobacter sp. CY261]
MNIQFLARHRTTLGIAVIVVLLFSFISLAVFAVLCLALVVRLALVDYPAEAAGTYEQKSRLMVQKITYYASVGLVCVAGIFTIANYVAAPSRIYKNADHHVIEHLGYTFEETMRLVDEGAPQSALWESGKGELELVSEPGMKRFLLNGKKFYEPLFVRENDAYVLANRQFARHFDSTFTVEFSKGRKVMMSVSRMNFSEPIYRYTYSSSDSTFAPIRIDFGRVIRTGISLHDLIGISPQRADEFEEVLALMEGTLLIREKYLLSGNDGHNNSPMHLFPSRIWADSVVSLSVDGLPVHINREFACSIPLAQGQFFYAGLKTKKAKTYWCDEREGESALYLTFPERKYLKSSDNEEEALLLTSSSSRVSDTDFPSVLLFDGPRSEQNVNHFTGGVTYRNGPTGEQMLFRVVNEVQEGDMNGNNAIQTAVAGDTIRIATSSSPEGPGHPVAWLLAFKDLKSENGLPFWLLAGYVVGFTLLAFVSIGLTPLGEVRNWLKLEVAVSITLLAFMVVRIVLLWRATTFLPVEDATAAEFIKLRALKEYFWYQLYASLAFWVLIIAFKVWAFIYNRWLPAYFMQKSEDKEPRQIWLYALFCLYGLVALKGFGHFERLVCVLVPVVTYFLIDFVFQRREASKFGYAVKSDQYAFVRKINWLAAVTAFAVGDAGFVIVFIVFSLMYWYLQIQVFPDHRLRSNLPKSRFARSLWPYRALLVGCLMVCFIAFSPHMLSFVFRNALWALQAVLIVMIAFVWTDRFVFRKWKVRITGMVALMMVLAVFGEQQLVKLLEDKNRMLYRAEIRFRTADEIIAAERFGLGNDRRLLNAAQNQWIIDHFYSKGAFDLYDYFKRVPHFQRGSSYLTQISDLVSVRYVIAEHSEVVLIALILLFAFLIQISVGKRVLFHSYTILRAQLLCFLFALSFTVWLAASDRMVFVGQDFPMLSLNSLLSIGMGFGLLLVVILAGYGKPTPEEASVPANTFESKGRRNFLSRFLQLVCLIAVGSYVLAGSSAQSFNLGQTIHRLEQSFEDLNAVFTIYQRETAGQSGTKSGQVGINALLEGFDEYLRVNEKDFFKGKTFEQSAYEAFLKKHIQSNSAGQLVHLKTNEDGIYEFAVNSFFYNINSPDVYQNAWHGNLVSSSVRKALSLVPIGNPAAPMQLDTNVLLGKLDEVLWTKRMLDSRQNRNVRLTLVPASWTKDSLPQVLLGRTQGEERLTRSTFLVKNGTELISSGQTKHGIRLKPNDVVHFQAAGTDGEPARTISFRLNQESTGYLAKNVWINGQRTHYYPLHERSLWSYYFANLIKSSFDKKADLREKDVLLTLDPGLTTHVYERVEKYFAKGPSAAKRGFSLVVLDSDGSIRALSEYKTDPQMRLDPNRMSDYQSLFEDLYMQPERFNERSIFGNKCLVRMPNGPASTFKPILYGAITSQYNLGWENLKFGGMGSYPIRSNKTSDDVEIRHFGGRSIRLYAGKSTIGEHDNISYLRNSTNTYNSMVVYLGSLTQRQIGQVASGLQSKQASDFLLPYQQGRDSLYAFPLIKFNEHTYRVGKMPDWDERASLMGKGLSENFAIPLSLNAENEPGATNRRNLAFGLDDAFINHSRSSYKLWSLPEPSHLYLVDRRQNIQNAVPQIAMGGYPIAVTPLKMAEMALNLFSANSATQASILANRQQTAPASFSVASNWGGEGNLASFYANNLFKGMYESIEAGTAVFLKNAKSAGYTLYAKTGTISGDRKRGESRDKNLMLIISQNPIHDRKLTLEDLRRNKFYVLYFSFYSDASLGGWSYDAQQTIRDIIADVRHTQDFKNFMKQENHTTDIKIADQ